MNINKRAKLVAEEDMNFFLQQEAQLKDQKDTAVIIGSKAKAEKDKQELLLASGNPEKLDEEGSTASISVEIPMSEYELASYIDTLLGETGKGIMDLAKTKEEKEAATTVIQSANRAAKQPATVESKKKADESSHTQDEKNMVKTIENLNGGTLMTRQARELLVGRTRDMQDKTRAGINTFQGDPSKAQKAQAFSNRSDVHKKLQLMFGAINLIYEVNQGLIKQVHPSTTFGSSASANKGMRPGFTPSKDHSNVKPAFGANGKNPQDWSQQQSHPESKLGNFVMAVVEITGPDTIHQDALGNTSVVSGARVTTMGRG